MSNDIDPNAVAAAVTTDLVKDFFKALVSTSGDLYTTALERSFPKFEAHMTEVHRRVSRVKLLCSPDAPTDFKSVYVCPVLKQGAVSVTDREFLTEVRKNRRVVVQSQGGAGKSFLMRDLWLSMFTEPSGRIPILVELRGLNDPSDMNLETYIRATATKSGLSEKGFSHFCDAGAFAFLLDGFDEVEKERRSELERQVLRLEKLYPDCSFVVTGRPDDRFGSWTQFKTYSCSPFSFDQFRELIEKVPFDETSKKKFLRVADKDFFEKHQDFLSNPLLALMMLMTYRDNAEIPSRLSVFYENCYFALFSRHDAMKEQFNRNKILDQNEFRRVFSLFSYFSYLKSKPDFTEGELDKYIETAIVHAGFSKSLEDVKNEFLETVNLVYKDGLKYWFVHRSFQEYFAAYCVTNILTDRITEALEVFAERRMDSTFSLAYEIHPDLVSKHYLLPTFTKYESRLCEIIEKSTTRNFSALSSIDFAMNGSPGVDKSGPRVFSWNIEKDLDVFLNAVLQVVADDEAGERSISYLHEGLMEFSGALRWSSSEVKEVYPSEFKFLTELRFGKTQPNISIRSLEGEEFDQESGPVQLITSQIERVAPKIGRDFENHYRSKIRLAYSAMMDLKSSEADKANRLAQDFGLS